ncbi:hypothetical protein [Burkholderia sp. Ac-20365]|uniref:hypothetical protein n=1 Tax=Burkholderia sp. Ac-20365 TaxID=2703897 RepID=UPI00197B95D0|nr:hypothetical protein [Burkholderia sp. Ac-20365]MBN3761233.1 hypothetical protein [Burkholderia sp. Ac-20365]
MTTSAQRAELFFITSHPGSGKSMLDTMSKLSGRLTIFGPTQTDGTSEFDEANKAAHALVSSLPGLHDAILTITEKSLSDDDLRELLTRLPMDLKKDIREYGLADTVVREQICAWLVQDNLV